MNAAMRTSRKMMSFARLTASIKILTLAHAIRPVALATISGGHGRTQALHSWSVVSVFNRKSVGASSALKVKRDVPLWGHPTIG